jgi:hypothetical protein
MVFIICAVIYAIGGLVYCIFCDGNLQKWAQHSSETQDSDEEITTKL